MSTAEPRGAISAEALAAAEARHAASPPPPPLSPELADFIVRVLGPDMRRAAAERAGRGTAPR